MLGNVLFIRVCRLTDLGSAKTFRHQRRRVFCVCVCWMWCVLNVLAGGSPSFMAVLNFVVVNVWNSHSFLFQPPPLVSFSMQSLCPHSWMMLNCGLVSLWCFTSLLLLIHFRTIHDTLGASLHGRSLAWWMFGPVHISVSLSWLWQKGSWPQTLI